LIFEISIRVRGAAMAFYREGIWDVTGDAVSSATFSAVTPMWMVSDGSVRPPTTMSTVTPLLMRWPKRSFWSS
jgi:hypothetical protein